MEQPRLRQAELLALLRLYEVEFVIIGGFSLAAHGVIRATKDVDVVPEPSADNLARLGRALKVRDEMRLVRLNLIEDVAGIRDYAQLRSGAVRVRDDWYAGYDELISMKSAAGRDQDLSDIAALETARRGG